VPPAARQDKPAYNSFVGLSADPFDPNYADVDKIIDTYKNEDAEKELAKKHMALGDDPRGGIDKISAASIKHSNPEDDRYLEKLFDGYSSAGKTPEGLPSSEDRVLNKWNTQLASEDVMRQWVELSDGAMEKFMKDNFDKVWDRYDQNKKGQIDMLDTKPFIRELLTSLQPPMTGKGVDPVEKFNEDNLRETKKESQPQFIKDKETKEFNKQVEKAVGEANEE